MPKEVGGMKLLKHSWLLSSKNILKNFQKIATIGGSY